MERYTLYQAAPCAANMFTRGTLNGDVELYVVLGIYLHTSRCPVRIEANDNRKSGH